MTKDIRIMLVGIVVFCALGCGPRGIASVEIRPRPKEMFALDRKGETQKFTAHGMDKNGLFVAQLTPTWESSDETVFRVDINGTVTAVASGKAELIAKHQALGDRIPIEVRIIGKILLEPSGDMTLKLGETRQMKATVLNDRGQELKDARITWTMSGFAADIDQSGLLRGQAIGDAVLSAQSGNETVRAKVDVLDR